MTAIQRIGRPRPIAVLVAALALLVAMIAIPASAQERFSGLTGTVTDASGAVLPGITVTITNKQTGKVFTAVTGADGVYRVLDLEPGRYIGEVRAVGVCDDGIPRRQPPARQDAVHRFGAEGRRRHRGHQRHRRVPADRHAQHDDRPQRDGRGVRAHSEGPQLPEPRAVVALGERGRGRRRHPGQRRQRIRELVHRRRRRHQQPDQRRVAPGRRVRISAGSPGEDRRHQRGIRRRAWRRHQRGHQVGRQHVSRRGPLLLHRRRTSAAPVEAPRARPAPTTSR